jgi:hypothetical protein
MYLFTASWTKPVQTAESTMTIRTEIPALNKFWFFAHKSLKTLPNLPDSGTMESVIKLYTFEDLKRPISFDFRRLVIANDESR